MIVLQCFVSGNQVVLLKIIHHPQHRVNSFELCHHFLLIPALKEINFSCLSIQIVDLKKAEELIGLNVGI